MNKDKIKEIFEKMRKETSEYTIKNLSDKPNEAGTYTIAIEKIRSQVPMTLKFDGIDWEKKGLESAMADANGDITKISYYHKEITKKLKNKM